MGHPAVGLAVLPVCPPSCSHRYLGSAPRRAGALTTDTHAEALEAAIGVVGAQVERAGDTLVAQAPDHVVLRAQRWELPDGPREGLSGASGLICPHSRWGPKARGSHGESTCMKGGHHVNKKPQLLGAYATNHVSLFPLVARGLTNTFRFETEQPG